MDIHEDCWPYLGFSWGTGVLRRYYVFRVLPFGIASACYVFTKLLQLLVKWWRSLEIRAIVYIDDGIVGAKSETRCLEHEEIVLLDLEEAGFILSTDKCCLKPCQVGDWLGFIIDLLHGQLRVPEHKLEKLKGSIRSVSQLDKIPVRALASMVDQIMSMSLALGPITRLRTRAVYTDINRSRSWANKLGLSADSQTELKFWLDSVDFLNG